MRKFFALFAVMALSLSAFAATPTGSVSLMDGANTIAVVTLDVNGNYSIANTQLRTLSIGSHNLSAVYSGDASHHPSTSPVVVQVVNDPVANTSTTLDCQPNPSLQNQQVTCSGSVQ